MKNFKIGSEICRLLEEADIPELRNKTFPIIAPATTQFPFLAYRRSYYRPQDNKDCLCEMVGIELLIASTTYQQSVDLAEKVAEALDRRETPIIEEIQISNIFEEFRDDTYVQHVNLDIYIK